jgi:hypothetical protein
MFLPSADRIMFSKVRQQRICRLIVRGILCHSADRVFSQFAYKLKKPMNADSSGASTMRRNQQLVGGIILLKEALALVPSLAEVNKLLCSSPSSSDLRPIHHSLCSHRFLLQSYT